MSDKLRDRLKEKLAEFETPQEFIDYLRDNGIELADEDLDEVVAGLGFDMNITGRPFEMAFAERLSKSGAIDRMADVFVEILARPQYASVLAILDRVP